MWDALPPPLFYYHHSRVSDLACAYVALADKDTRAPRGSAHKMHAHAHRQASSKRQVVCVGDRLRMGQKAWNNNSDVPLNR